MKKIDKVQEMFSSSRGAKMWDDMYSSEPETFEQYIFSARRDDAVRFIENNFSKDSCILDLGCGAGPFVSEISKRGYSCFASDYSRDILEKAAQRISAVADKNVPLLQSNCQFIPFADNSFDAVVCLGVISYVPDRSAAILEMKRILKPGGKLYITYRNYYNLICYNLPNFLMWITGRDLAHLNIERKGKFSAGAFLKPNYMEALLVGSGLKITRKYGIGRGPLKLTWRLGMPEKLSMKLDKFLQKLLGLIGLSSLLLASDIVVYECEKEND